MCWTRFSKRRAIRILGPWSIVLGSLAGLSAGSESAAVEVLTPTGGLPPEIVGQMREPAAFIQASDGSYLIFDPRAQQVYGVDAAKKVLKKLVAIGPSDGQILRPGGFAYSPNKTFIVIDAPANYERVQTFYEDGTALSRFQRWPARGGAVRVSVNGVMFGGLNAIAPIGRNILTGAQSGNALISELDTDGNIVRHIGTMRATGQDGDAQLRRALNTGIPVVAPDGSVYFVFTSGLPMFRKYSAAGELLFERHIEGPELDSTIQQLPTVWPRRKLQGDEFPVITATVATAALDPRGHLWVSFETPFTYVYDGNGNKTRTVQFRGTELMSPTSFFFTRAGRLLITPGCYEFSPY